MFKQEKGEEFRPAKSRLLYVDTGNNNEIGTLSLITNACQVTGIPCNASCIVTFTTYLFLRPHNKALTTVISQSHS